jgi:uncharacterized protein
MQKHCSRIFPVPLDLSPAHLTVVREILSQKAPRRAAWAFGSRVQGTAHRFSDLDICLDGEQAMGFEERANLRLAFSESDLPFVVDLVELKRCSAAFASAISAQREPLTL